MECKYFDMLYHYDHYIHLVILVILVIEVILIILLVIMIQFSHQYQWIASISSSVMVICHHQSWHHIIEIWSDHIHLDVRQLNMKITQIMLNW